MVIFSRMRLTGVGRFQCSRIGLHSGISKLVFVEPSPMFSLESGVFFLIFFFLLLLLLLLSEVAVVHSWLSLSLVVCGSVLQQVCTVELFFVSHPGLGGKYREECCRGTRGGGGEQQRQREGSTLQEFCWVGVSLLHDQCPPLMSTQCQIQRVSATPPPAPSPVPTVFASGTKPPWKRYGVQHLETLINGYFCMRRRQRDRVYFVK